MPHTPLDDFSRLSTTPSKHETKVARLLQHTLVDKEELVWGQKARSYWDDDPVPWTWKLKEIVLEQLAIQGILFLILLGLGLIVLVITGRTTDLWETLAFMWLGMGVMTTGAGLYDSLPSHNWWSPGYYGLSKHALYYLYNQEITRYDLRYIKDLEVIWYPLLSKEGEYYQGALQFLYQEPLQSWAATVRLEGVVDPQVVLKVIQAHQATLEQH